MILGEYVMFSFSRISCLGVCWFGGFHEVVNFINFGNQINTIMHIAIFQIVGLIVEQLYALTKYGFGGWNVRYDNGYSYNCVLDRIGSIEQMLLLELMHT
eukprot:TRINITY_DN2943_c0_g2_i1.p10 TRINITY_DN2943_c0_g2~~TRINITY_DN2943_c0_g2_i1.p10  ORF type:complete len:100 (-),score=7.83 TRINITY_DN2943_c0_g2_i1:142-441(-)